MILNASGLSIAEDLTIPAREAILEFGSSIIRIRREEQPQKSASGVTCATIQCIWDLVELYSPALPSWSKTKQAPSAWVLGATKQRPQIRIKHPITGFGCRWGFELVSTTSQTNPPATEIAIQQLVPSTAYAGVARLHRNPALAFKCLEP